VGAPDVTGELRSAGFYAVLGGLLLKLLQVVVRAMEKKKRESLAEIDATFHVGAALREELRKENEQLRTRLDAAEVKIQWLEETTAGLQRDLAEAQSGRRDAEDELRLWKKGLRSPRPPTAPPVGGPRDD
jgi:hypothetical protein